MCPERNGPGVNMLIKVVGFDLRLRPRLSKCCGNEKKDDLYESECLLAFTVMLERHKPRTELFVKVFELCVN